jgi:hypothetical protein
MVASKVDSTGTEAPSFIFTCVIFLLLLKLCKANDKNQLNLRCNFIDNTERIRWEREGAFIWQDYSFRSGELSTKFITSYEEYSATLLHDFNDYNYS